MKSSYLAKRGVVTKRVQHRQPQIAAVDTARVDWEAALGTVPGTASDDLTFIRQALIGLEQVTQGRRIASRRTLQNVHVKLAWSIKHLVAQAEMIAERNGMVNLSEPEPENYVEGQRSRQAAA